LPIAKEPARFLPRCFVSSDLIHWFPNRKLDDGSFDIKKDPTHLGARVAFTNGK